MAEINLSFPSLDPLDLYGTNNTKLKIIEAFFPKLKIVARGHSLKAIGDEGTLEIFEHKFKTILARLERYNSLNETHVIEILEADLYNEDRSDALADEKILVFGNNGKPIKPRNKTQIRMVQEAANNDLVFAVGPAGSGKTYLAVALAVRALKNKEVRKIILSRPAVEAGERLGFLPGDLAEKLDPYLQPLYDALRDMIPHYKLSELMAEGIIQIAPLAFMRGRTLSNAYVILDEAQNATIKQFKMFLTRMGENSKFIVTGDITQIDLPRKNTSGLTYATRILEGIPGIAILPFGSEDIIRHRLVSLIATAFDKHQDEEDEVFETPAREYRSGRSAER